MTEIINKLAEGVRTTGVAVASGIAGAVLVCLFIWFLVAGSEDVPKIKKWFIRVVVGYIGVLSVSQILSWLQSLAGGSF